MICASDWRAMQRNTPQGFCTLHLEPSGLASKPQIDRDGNHRQDLKTGKQAYVAIVEIPDKDHRERFQVAAVRALLGKAAP